MVRNKPSRQESSSTLVMEDLGTTSDSASATSEHPLGDSKPIPFLRRLRDMLIENEDSISFVPGRRTRTGENISLGRIVVHDRIRVEAKVLPKYFNHSSFASLRRQLNYFKFVRLGKGRQLESTYVNDCVVDLDDVLTLKRRSVSAILEERRQAEAKKKRTTTEKTAQESSATSPTPTTSATGGKRRASETLSNKNSSLSVRAPVSTEVSTSLSLSQGEGDMQMSDYDDRQEILAGCQALLGLSGKEWTPHS